MAPDRGFRFDIVHLVQLQGHGNRIKEGASVHYVKVLMRGFQLQGFLFKYITFLRLHHAC